MEDEIRLWIHDGYGIPFDPIRHTEYITNTRVEDFTPPECDVPVYNGSLKDKPAGWWDKSLSDGDTRQGM